MSSISKRKPILKNQPLVSIICLCYNHELYVSKTLDSIAALNYKNFELIIIDDCSTDASSIKIKQWLETNQKLYLKDIRVEFFMNSENIGNTRSFNKALEISKGDYIIDLATDDLMLPDVIEKHIHNFNTYAGKRELGVSYCNVAHIAADDTFLNFHFSKNGIISGFPKSGNLYNVLLRSYYVNPVGVCFSRKVFDHIGGYDEILSYEDFDFWIRSSFIFDYAYVDVVGMKKRVLPNSHSLSAFQSLKKRHLIDRSTYFVCKKAFYQNITLENSLALQHRIIHCFKIAVKSYHISLVVRYTLLFLKNKWTIYKKVLSKTH